MHRISRASVASLVCAALVVTAPARAAGYALAGKHNGSDVDILDNRIVYATPKASIRDVVRPGTTLVEGRWNGDRFTGFAYAFKKGCAPARYAVVGRRGDDGTMVFTGPGPVRNGCDVIRYDAQSPHARLVVDGIWSP